MTLETEVAHSSSPALVWQGQWLGWFGLGMLIFFTLLPRSYFAMVAWPWIAIWQLGFWLLGLWAVWMLRQFHLPFKPLGFGLDWAVGAIAVALLVSGGFCQFREVAGWSIAQALCYVVLLYVMRNWLGNGRLSLERVWAGIPLLAVVACVTGLISWREQWLAGADRLQFPLGHPNFVAGFVLLVLPLTLALAVNQTGWQRWSAWAACPLLLGTLYVTGSRGGFVGLLALLLATAGVWIVLAPKQQRSRRLIVGLVVLIASTAIALSNPRVQNVIKINSPGNQLPLIQLQVDGPTSDRFIIWRSLGGMMRKHFLLGVGPGNMSRVYNLYRPIETGGGATNVQQLHSTPFQLLGELGLLGVGAILWFLVSLGRCWLSLWQQLKAPQHRRLLWAIGGSLLAYGASSLTDYQLENIPINALIVMLVALLIALGDREKCWPAVSLPKMVRRGASIGGIGALTLALLIWLPVSAAAQISEQSLRNSQSGNLAIAYEQSSLAAALVPWDPIPSLLAGFQLLNLQENISDPSVQKKYRETVLSHFQQALNAAPYDFAFNQNLGFLLREFQQGQPETYFRKTIQLLPRNQILSYYFLGQELLKQGDKQGAIAAFALQGIIDPDFILAQFWQEPSFKPIEQPVLEKVLSLFEVLLAETPRDASNYPRLYENYAIVRWWVGRPLEVLEEKYLRNLIQVFLKIEGDPKAALAMIDRAKQSQTVSANLLLLGAWLQPETYLQPFQETDYYKSYLTQKNKGLLQESFQQRSLRSWLVSQTYNLSRAYRIDIALAYRNSQVDLVSTIFQPSEIDLFSLVRILNLFPDYLWVFPQLDELIVRVGAEALKIPRP